MHPTSQDTGDVRSLVAAFPRLRVAVVGDAILDGYLTGRSDRLCREAPVPVVDVSETAYVPGGAANAAANLAALGARTSLVSVVGPDAEGERLLRLLSEAGVDVGDVLAHRERRTLTKRRVLSGGQMLLRVDEGDVGEIPADASRLLARRLRRAFAGCDAIVVSDYGYGTLTAHAIRELAALQGATPRVLVADSRRLALYHNAGLTAVKPNYGETLRLLAGSGHGGTHTDGSRAERMSAYGERVLDVTGARLAAVTLDTEGALLFERGRPPYRTYAEAHPDGRSAGAGDTFVAALTLALASGAEGTLAAEVASAAAAVVVRRDGTTSCTAEELTAAFPPAPEDGEAALARLVPRLEERRATGGRIVLTNGCFDVLHRGHVDFLNRARALGDFLVVGLNDDDGVRRLKGPGRPLNPLADRLRVLSALSCVDGIVPFTTDDAAGLAARVRPDVYAKGADHDPASLPEAGPVLAAGGRIEILPLFEGATTEELLRRMRGADREPVGAGA